MTVDISSLPAPEVVEALSFEAILADTKADLIARFPADEQADIAALLDLESDPITKLLETAAYRELQLRARINDEARALLLAFATGANLEHIGATYYQEPKLVVTPADPEAIPPVAAVMESDDDYRYRLALKPESYSTAGPRDAYEYHSLSANGQVKNAKPTSPIKGTTEVFILSRTGNGTPSPELLATVEAALNIDSVRPESEEVIVSPCTVVEYTLDVGLVLFPGAIGEVAIAAALKSLTSYTVEFHKPDGDIVESAIKAAAHKPGVKKAIVTSPPADIVCTPGQAPYCIGINVTIAGIES